MRTGKNACPRLSMGQPLYLEWTEHELRSRAGSGVAWLFIGGMSPRPSNVAVAASSHTDAPSGVSQESGNASSPFHDDTFESDFFNNHPR